MNDRVSKNAPRASGFVLLSNSLICDPEVTPIELRIVCIIGEYQQHGFYRPVEYLAKICGVSDRTIQRTLRVMEKKRLIVGFPRTKQTTIYRVFRTGNKVVIRPDQETFDRLKSKALGKESRVTPMSPRGDKCDIPRVTPMSPNHQDRTTNIKSSSALPDFSKETDVLPAIGTRKPIDFGALLKPMPKVDP